MSSRKSPYYPIYLDLQDREVLIVGGGDVCARKAEGLMRCGARVTVVSPANVAKIQRWGEEGRLTLHQRLYAGSDIEGKTLVVAATNDPSVNAGIAKECRRRLVLVNVVDGADPGDYVVPAIVEQGSIQIAVSTGGNSPALARKLREDLLQLVGPEYSEVAEIMGSLRDAAKRVLPTDAKRKRFFDSLLDGPLLELLKGGRRREAGAEVIRACTEAGIAPGELVMQLANGPR